jgi:DNA-binding response OmpR family regulator
VKVLVVEDEDALAGSLLKGLAREGFEVTRAATGGAALEHGQVDVVLLDLRLPDMDGLDVCKEMRARSAVPIIIVSARGEEADRVVGLELGADDYIVKPFGFREVVARIRAVTRRAAQPREEHEPLVAGPLVVDVRTRRTTLDGRSISLTPKEFDLLALLAADAGAVVTRNHILHDVWQTDWYGPSKTIDVHVASLRRKLGDQRWIETLRGVGFRLVVPE